MFTTSIPLQIVQNDPSYVPIDELQNLLYPFKQSVYGCETSTCRKIILRLLFIHHLDLVNQVLLMIRNF